MFTHVNDHLQRHFDAWLHGLRDVAGQVAVQRRIDRLAAGNPGDHRGVGEGVMELRIATGPGYRVYYVQRGTVLVVLLVGGDKSSQRRDIRTAKQAAADYAAATAAAEPEAE